MLTRPVRTLIHDIAAQLEPVYESAVHAQTVAWWLLEGITKKNKTRLIVDIFVTLSEEQQSQLAKWVSLHVKQQYPLQYLLGSVAFGSLDIIVKAPTLIPRPETEEWCASVINTLADLHEAPLRILDMCTGSGCIGLWFAKSFPNSKVIAVDIADTALTLAKRNAEHNAISNILFLRSDLFTLLDPEQPFDLILSNPPYVSPEAWHDLSPNVTQWEDRGALVAGNHGLDLIQAIATQAPAYLKKQSLLTQHGYPRLVMEIGYDQGPETQKLFMDAGFGTVKVVPDSAERDRVVCGW